MYARHTILMNWKANPETRSDALYLFDALKTLTGKMRSLHIVLAPSAIHLSYLRDTYKGNKISFAAQDFSGYKDAQYTGQITIEQFADAGTTYAIIGHGACMSPQQTRLDELRIKTFFAQRAGITPIIFIGEDKYDESGKYLRTIKEQVLSALKELTLEQVSQVIICYEPKWVSGITKTPSVYHIHTTVLYIRKIIAREYTKQIAFNIRILYAGNVSDENIEEILAIEDVNGIGIGRASLGVVHFSSILKIANKA